MSVMLMLAAAVSNSPDCKNTTIQSELNECAQTEFAEADRALNAQWKTTVRIFRERSREDEARLRVAQRAWLTFRDADCAARWPFDLGISLDKMLHINCLTKLTIERTDTLAELAKDI
ncbi:lysozyme inhibitor LprI family protein [Novosphingobium sp. ERW19]|jgi:uncharacterized protein YecT (DUF1311 family)|uniref:lysozyme inhibitor LprI family protein n=1 Tax=Novosphingobium sp. ERW19 TaxID=2726186 RepID=UPI0014564E0C|nr:lysozyme inhibitor LprI family protein [Novosphingobium sp. ERW19]MBA4088134.1 hypothetical protein [Novosphingobium sp.]NLR38702.1 DUF1311 domain-containing protein [Novosphingobium sp. ERW19]